MSKTTVIIPNYNGIAYLEKCLLSLEKQSQRDFITIVVDNGSMDGSSELVKEKFPQVKVIQLKENTGFCGAVNEGIKQAKTPYVILLNNDTEADSEYVNKMTIAIEEDEKLFSVSAKVLSMAEPEKIDDAGDLYSALGWARGRGCGKSADEYRKTAEVFASCGAGAIYRKKIMDEIGMFDSNHFAYLEDIDIGYRAKIYGYRNSFTPFGIVYHVGSGFSGSKHNSFKIKLSSKNSIYLIYKNMPVFQIVLNLPFLILGFSIKYLYFLKKGFGGIYLKGILKGIKLCTTPQGKANKVKFCWKNIGNYTKIQLQLWRNMVRFN